MGPISILCSQWTIQHPQGLCRTRNCPPQKEYESSVVSLAGDEYPGGTHSAEGLGAYVPDLIQLYHFVVPCKTNTHMEEVCPVKVQE